AFLSETTRWKSAFLRCGVMSHSYPPHYRTALAFSSILCPPPQQRSLRKHLPPGGGMSGLPCFVQTALNDDLAPASTPTVLLSVCLHGVGKQLDCMPFWLKPNS